MEKAMPDKKAAANCTFLSLKMQNRVCFPMKGALFDVKMKSKRIPLEIHKNPWIVVDENMQLCYNVYARKGHVRQLSFNNITFILFFHGGIMYRFEESKRIKREEYPQLRKSSGGVIAIQLGLQPTFFMSGEDRNEQLFWQRFRKKK